MSLINTIIVLKGYFETFINDIPDQYNVFVFKFGSLKTWKVNFKA